MNLRCSLALLFVVVGGAPAHAVGDLVRTFDAPPTANSRTSLGSSVAIDGDIVLIGATGRHEGQAHIFDVATGSLLQTFDDPTPSTRRGDLFGFSVAIDGNYALIGAPGDLFNGSPGEAFLFDATTGDLLQTLNTPTFNGDANFGSSVAIDGENLLIGEPGSDDAGGDDGIAHLFNARTGALLHTFTDPTNADNGRFGDAVAIEGDNVLVGAPAGPGSSSGQAHLFSTTTGNPLRIFGNPTPMNHDAFGDAVAIEGDNVLIGAPNWSRSEESGQAFAFSVSTGDLLQTFDDPTPTFADLFGRSVAIDGAHALVGAGLDDTNGSQVGQAHLFDVTTGSLVKTFDDPTPTSQDVFGGSVAIDGDNVLIGARGDDTNGVGSGQAHLFDLTVPEPSGFLLAALGVLPAGVRRRAA